MFSGNKGSITVKVLDSKGKPIKSATVTIKEQHISKTTNDKGEAFFVLSAGSYTIEVSKPGYETVIKSVKAIKAENKIIEIKLKRPGEFELSSIVLISIGIIVIISVIFIGLIVAGARKRKTKQKHYYQ